MQSTRPISFAHVGVDVDNSLGHEETKERNVFPFSFILSAMKQNYWMRMEYPSWSFKNEGQNSFPD